MAILGGAPRWTSKATVSLHMRDGRMARCVHASPKRVVPRITAERCVPSQIHWERVELALGFAVPVDGTRRTGNRRLTRTTRKGPKGACFRCGSTRFANHNGDWPRLVRMRKQLNEPAC